MPPWTSLVQEELGWGILAYHYHLSIHTPTREYPEHALNHHPAIHTRTTETYTWHYTQRGHTPTNKTDTQHTVGKKTLRQNKGCKKNTQNN